jgi:hypothetical protein
MKAEKSAALISIFSTSSIVSGGTSGGAVKPSDDFWGET